MKKYCVLILSIFVVFGVLFSSVLAGEVMRKSVFTAESVTANGVSTSDILQFPEGITKMSYVAKVTGDGRLRCYLQGGPLGTGVTYYTNKDVDNATIYFTDNMTSTSPVFKAVDITDIPVAWKYKVRAEELDGSAAALTLDLIFEKQ